MRRSRFLGLVSFTALATIAAISPSPAFAADAYVTMSNDRRFRTWTKMIDAADLQGYAKGHRPYTIFAPVEDSLNNIDPELMKAIGPTATDRGADFSQMTFVVQSHVTRGKLASGDLAGKVSTLQSVNGRSIVVDATKSPIAVTFAGSQGTMTGPPIVTDNAIIYPVLLTAAHYTAQ